MPVATKKATVEVAGEPSVNDKAVAVAQSNALTVNQQSFSLVIVTNDAEFQQAAELLKQCATARSIVEAHMDPLCDAANRSHKMLTAKRTELLRPVLDAEAHLKNIRRDYQLRIAEDNRRIEEKAAKKGVAAPALRELPKTEGVSTRKVWKYRVTDFSKLPDKYKVENERLLRAEAGAMKERFDVPGAEAYEDFQDAVRG